MGRLYIDQRFAGYLSGRLKNFKQYKAGNFRFTHSCESGAKQRAYIYPKGEGLNVFCHNCQYSTTLGGFIKEQDQMMFDEYRMELFKDTLSTKEAQNIVFQKTVEEVKQTDPTDIEFLDTLKATHPARRYVESRKVPEKFFDRIGFVKDFNRFAANLDDSFKDRKMKYPRLIIPFFDEQDQLISISARAFGKEIPKYIKLNINPNKEMIYGLWKLDKSRPIIVVEGQFDSLFLDNAVAVGGADYSKQFLLENKEKIVICPDNDWIRNPQVAKSVKNAIDAGFNVSFFPETIKYKDINDCVVKGGMTGTELTAMILNNSRSGPEANIEFIFRKKC